MNQTLASIRDVAVRYGATTALDGVSLDLLAGEVHALVGENGAGKSTLLRVLSGARQPDEGQVEHPPGIRVAWVPQEPDLPPDLTVEEAVYLGAELCRPGGWLRRRAMRDGARALLTQVGSSVEPALRAGSLSAPQRKQVQIAQALRHNPDVLLLDEPTAVLGAHETARLFAILAQRRRDGQATVYVSHRLDEVMQVADRVTVLRDGVRVSTDLAHAVTPDDLVTRMVGRTVPARQRIDRRHGAEAVRLTHVSAGAARDVSLAVRRGEIIGLAGLMGAGRSDLLEAIAGLQPVRQGTIDCAAAAVLLPADRGRNGLVPPFSVRENLFLPAPRFWLDRRRECRDAAAWIDRLRIRTASVEASIDSLSGGNQQKLLLARALRHQPQVFLLDEPTAGIDIGAKAEIHVEITRLADAGMAVLLASSELTELLLLCDRILAMYAGRIVGEVSAADATEAYVATLITGGGTVSGAGCRVSGVEPR